MADAEAPKQQDVQASGAPKGQKKGAGKKKEKKDKKDKKPKQKEGGKPDLMEPQPAYIKERLDLFDELYKKQQEELANKTPEPIKITLPDGTIKDGESWRTTPADIASQISEGLANKAVISKVNGVLWDLERPFEESAKLEILDFSDDEAKSVFWHSSAHILGEAMELHCGGCLCYGPPIKDGFYYDTYLGDESIAEASFSSLEKLAKKAVKEKQPFQRLVMTKADLLKMFEYNQFKKRIIEERITTDSTTVYRCGPLIDLCRGPHVRHTGKIKAFAVTKNSSTYWEGNSEAETLQRVYGISFPDTKQMKEWKKFQEEAAKRDHRKIGREQELFFFHDLSPGSCFFTPRGATIYNRLIDLMKTEYRKRGFQEVVTPNIFNSKLWETSGHWQHYAENMFQFDCEEQRYALKPMNCPGHCLMFGHRSRSYRELPLRLADFGVLHRNELSGALSGLTRVRRFQQDDAHIFCMPSQIEDEIKGCLEFLDHIYTQFGFSFELNLSTRPKKYLGEIAVWDKAEASLKEALNGFGHPWKLNPEDGAFYGPKIDITILDALKRAHQCATIQLDFQLPERFGLEYVPAEQDAVARPVIIHRAILGSVERMIAILTENYAGKWPFWLSPRQVQIIPVHPKFNEYAEEVRQILHDAGYAADTNTDDGSTLNKKIRNGQLDQYNFVMVVGEKEKDAKSVNVRNRSNEVQGERTMTEVLEHFKHLSESHSINDAFPAKEEAGQEAAADPVAPKTTVVV